MKAVILAGGMGSRISEESHLKPKPMIEIGGRPILWHIMKIYSSYGIREFIVCCGYKGHMIKDYFVHYPLYESNIKVSLREDKRNVLENHVEPWRITLANTGLKTLTAGRIARIKDYLEKDEEFMLTYGDGVSDVNLKKLLEFHHQHGKIATITTVQPVGRFGTIGISASNQVESFREKARKDQAWVNTGFMVFHKKVFDYLGEDDDMLEAGPFARLVADGEMMAYKHDGFWSPMDTMKDKEYLETLWEEKKAAWKIW